MIKNLLLTILIFSNFRLLCQDTLLKKDISLKYVFNDNRESLPLLNSDKNEVVLFLLDNWKIKSLVFNRQYKLIDSCTTDRPDKKFENLLGHNADSIGYHLFFANKYSSQFYIKTIDIHNNKCSSEPEEFKLKDEKFLETVSYQNKFYILTALKRSSIIRIYVFEGKINSRIENIDLSNVEFSNVGYTKLYDVLFADNTTLVQKIDNLDPNSLDLTSEKNKIYYEADKIYITLDNNIENTKVITIDLDDFQHNVKFYDQGSVMSEISAGIRSNSYIYQHTLYQIKGCKEEMYFSILDLSTNSLIKDFRIKQDEEIWFKNTAIIQDGGTTVFVQGSEKELDNTRQALRKISSGHIGISAYQSGGNLELTLGGFKEIQRNIPSGGGMMMAPGTAISTPYGMRVTTPTYSYNPTMYGFSRYTNTRAVYFKALFDKEVNHITGDIPKNAFDKIHDYKDIHDHDISTETVFKVDDYYIFGYYDQWEKKYYLIKFVD